MVSNDYVHRILIVCSGEKSRYALKNYLLDSHYTYQIQFASNGLEAKRELMDKQYDVVLINSPLIDEFGDDLAIYAVENTNSEVLMLLKNESYDDKISNLLKYNIFTLLKPLSKITFLQMIQTCNVLTIKKKELQRENIKLKEKLEEQRIVNKAKCLLIEKTHISENEAHKLIEKRAMDSREKKIIVAVDIIKEIS